MKNIKSLLILFGLLLFPAVAQAACTSPFSALDGSGTAKNIIVNSDGTNCYNNSVTGSGPTNPTSTLTLTSSTTAYAAGQLMANNATAGSITVPSFSIQNSGGAFNLNGGRLTIADNTSTGPYNGTIIQLDFWTAAPTFTNGDRGVYSIATGSAGYLGSMSCTMTQPITTNDGAYSRCAMIGPSMTVTLSGSSVFWTAQAISATLTTGASKVVTFTPEIAN
jgi:hypothetical protein